MVSSAEILAAFREVSNTKQLDRSELYALLQDGILAALAKKYGPNVQAEVNIDDGKAYDVGRAPGIRQGAKDTLPPPNPITGAGASGANSITANSPATTTINNGAHDNQNGNSGGNGHGNGNGNGFGGGTGFDPSF